MFYAIVGVLVAAFFGLQLDKIKIYPKNPVLKEYQYEYEVEKQELKDEYKKSKLPKSGYMLLEDYERDSKSVDNENRVVEEAKKPIPKPMKYVPQPTYKLIKYNKPPGTPELNIPRKLDFQRQINTQGIVSGDFTKLVYSSVYYYPKERCICCDVFVIPLDTTVNRVERVMKANVVKKNPKPIFSTIKDLSQDGAFRTITPIDYSEDNRYIVAKEKTGYVFDGIWKTEVLVHDFQTGKTKKLNEVREAILDYWHNVSGVEFDDYRWDIYPLGFNQQNPNQILVSGYAYTGGIPIFLGTWGVDITGERCELVNLSGRNYSVSIVGYKLAYDGYISREEVMWQAKRDKKYAKKSKKRAKKELKKINKAKKAEYKKKLKQLKMQYKLRKKIYKKHRKSGMSGLDGNVILPEENTQSIDEIKEIK